MKGVKIMNKMYYFLIAFFILSIGFYISHWTNKPIQTYTPLNNSLKNCMDCHNNSISQDAWKGIPSWHNEKFCNPILNSENREEHRRVAHSHRNECMTCHSSNFQAKCTNCHIQTEW